MEETSNETSNETSDQSNIDPSFQTRLSGEDKSQKLGRMPPLKTVAYLSVGPIISQLSLASTGIINTLYAAKAIGDIGVEVFGAIYVVEFIATSMAYYFMSSVSLRLPYLFGQNHMQEVSQIYVDFLRLSLFIGVIIPMIVLPITKPLVMWFGADQALANMCLQYMIPQTVGSCITFMFNVSCGLIQAEGKSMTFAWVQFGVFALAQGVLQPTFLFALKVSIWGSSLSIILAQLAFTVPMIIRVFQGKSTLRPNLSMFRAKMSKETFSALRVGFSAYLDSISTTIPLILMQKYVNLAALSIGKYNEVIRIWAIIEKLSLIVNGLCTGLAQGFSPAASYAYGAGRFNRLMRMFYHSLWITFIFTVVNEAVILLFTKEICAFWSTDESFLELAEKMVPIYFYTSWTLGLQFIVPAILPAMKRVLMSVLLSILTLLIPLPLFSSILYFTNKSDPVRILHTYNINDIYTVVIDILFMIKPMKMLMKSEASDESKRPHFDPIGGVEEEEVEENV